MGALADQLAAMTPEERRAARAQAWKAIDALDGRTFTPRAGVVLTIVSSDLLRDGQGRVAGVQFHITLTRNGTPVNLGDGVFGVINPPLTVDKALTPAQITAARTAFASGVPTQAQINTWLSNRGIDPTTHILRYQKDRDGIWQFRLLEEAPLKALREWLYDALKAEVG